MTTTDILEFLLLRSSSLICNIFDCACRVFHSLPVIFAPLQNMNTFNDCCLYVCTCCLYNVHTYMYTYEVAGREGKSYSTLAQKSKKKFYCYILLSGRKWYSITNQNNHTFPRFAPQCIAGFVSRVQVFMRWIGKAKLNKDCQ